MRVSLIHGEDTEKAYRRFRELIDGAKAKGFNIETIDDIHKITSQSLFEDKLVFVLEKPNKVKANSWKWLSQNALKYNSNLLIYYSGNAPILLTKNLPKDAKKEKFELPKILFSFLDSFSLKIFNDLVQIEPVELVFHLLARRLRDLYWVKTSPETLIMQDWQKNRLKSQANKFTEKKIKKIIKELAEIDIKAKTGGGDLKRVLDILIVERLK